MSADRDTSPGLVIDRKASKPSAAPASRKVQAFRWYTVAVVLLVVDGHFLGVDGAVLSDVVDRLTWGLAMVMGANALGDHAAGAVGKVGELVAGALAGRRS